MSAYKEHPPSEGQGGDQHLFHSDLTPRRWAHDRTDCTTCQAYDLLVDRRRRQEIQALTNAMRIIDLRSEEDVAWVEAHVHAHDEQERDNR